MTIEKGRSWGEPAEGIDEPAIADDDAALAALAARALSGGSTLVAELRSGDLLKTLGLSEPRPPEERFAYPVDLGLAHLGRDTAGLDVEPLPFVAHLVAGRLNGLLTVLGYGPGITAVVMNGAWLGEYRLGPRAHPNDGLLDVTDGRVPLNQRREAARRATTGAHLPHPALKVSRVPSWERTFSRPVMFWLDGVKRGRHRSVRVEVVPDALTVVA